MQDLIRVNDLLLTVSLAAGAHWPQKIQPVEQPILVTLSVPHSVKKTASTDDLQYSIDYSALAKRLRTSLGAQSTFQSLEEFTIYTFDTLLGPRDDSDIKALHVRVVQLKSPLHSKLVGLEAYAESVGTSERIISKVKHFFEDIQCHAIIGVNANERVEKQIVKINIAVEGLSQDLSQKSRLDFRALTRRLYESVGGSSFLTLEALASHIAIEVLQHLRSNTPDSRDVAVKVRAAKPNALVFASSSEVEVRRVFDDYPAIFNKDITGAGSLNLVPSASGEIVAIALGSNIGDRFQSIEYALRLLEVPGELLSSENLDEHENPKDFFLTVVDTSFLYETTPMYVADQPPFINCACLVETNIQPIRLLALLKHIEAAVGRVPSIRNGPRAVDLDIIFYGKLALDTRSLLERVDLENLAGQLVIPHPRMQEREFVLRPLNDMVPDYIHPIIGKSISQLLDELPETDPSMQKVVPFPCHPFPSNSFKPHAGVSSVPPTLTHWTYPSTSPSNDLVRKRKTHIMATLNATPDSFSDGAVHNSLETALEYTQKAIVDGSTIIDIGGYSTKPGAAFVSIEEEKSRVIPIIQATRSSGSQAGVEAEGAQKSSSHSEHNSRLRDVPISIDTFRWEVAEASILAGANCINDVYAFTGRDTYPMTQNEQKERADECMAGMKRVAREYAVPVILMHSRGDAGKNTDYEMYKSSEAKRGAVVEGVRIELGAKVDRIVKGKGGVRRWMVILDPGVGFSKSVEGNLEVIRSASSIVADIRVGKGNSVRNPLRGHPLLIGTSRKSYLGRILAEEDEGRIVEPVERDWATSAAIACAVQQGAMVVRVHDTKAMADVVAVADKLWG